jgi:hypothetical protein
VPQRRAAPFAAAALDDPHIRARVETARTLGISVKRLDGWEPREIHEHEYDESGRLARTVVVREVEWDDEERGWLLALAEREAAECRRCGGDLIETTKWSNRYVPQAPLVCLRCLALHQAEESHRKHPHAAGMIHRVERTERRGPKPTRPER